MSRYMISLAHKHYAELRHQLEGHCTEHGHMGETVMLMVDEVGRDVVESRLPGRVRWNSREFPRKRPTREQLTVIEQQSWELLKRARHERGARR